MHGMEIATFITNENKVLYMRVPLKEKGYYSLIKAGELLKLALFFICDIIVIAKWLHQKGFSEQDCFCVNYTHVLRLLSNENIPIPSCMVYRGY
jgi:hypothetical protein